MFAACGAQIRCVATKDSQWQAGMHAAVGGGAEFVVVIGGDGTVRKVVIELAGSPTPIRLIPSGTTNNVTRSVGITGPP